MATKKSTKPLTKKSNQTCADCKRNTPAVILGFLLCASIITNIILTVLLYCNLKPVTVSYDYPSTVSAEQREIFDAGVADMIKSMDGEESLSSLAHDFLYKIIVDNPEQNYSAEHPLNLEILSYGVTKDNDFTIRFKFNHTFPDGTEDENHIGNIYFQESDNEPGHYGYAFSYEN